MSIDRMFTRSCAVAALLTIGGATCAGCIRSYARPGAADDAAAALSRCLAARGATMYGAAWCSHCQRQKQLFGPAFANVPYVECPEQPERCVALQVHGYPTWVFADGTRVEGVQTLPQLAQAAGCASKP